MPGKPTYSLAVIRRLIAHGQYLITRSAFEGALAIGYDDEMLLDVVLRDLGDDCFHKTMEAEKAPGLWQDVYKVTVHGMRLYVKVQIQGFRAVVVSFKESGFGR